jgi:hypothetical protein
MRETTIKMPKDIEEFRRIVEQMASSPGEFTKNMAAMQEAVQKGKVAAEGLADKALPRFSGALVTTAETMDAVTQKLKNLLDGIPSPSRIEAQPQSVRQSWQAATTGQAAAGTIPGVAEYPAWEPGAVPGSLGKKGKPNTAIPFDTSGVDRYALGGITNGISIAGEQGPEAVVPLPDGRTIPVEIKSTESVYSQFERSTNPMPADSTGGLESFLQNQLKAMQNSASTLENILTVLRDSYDTQDRLLANSY